MVKSLSSYANYVFDCDGVILESNQIKSAVFLQVVEKFGATATARFKSYLERNGGVNRRKKFQHFFEDILLRTDYAPELAQALTDFHQLSLAALASAQHVPGVTAFLREIAPTAKCFVVSASDETDLRQTLEHHRLTAHFAGIFGAPRSKVEILSELELAGKTVYFGDSRVDYETAKALGYDFVFVHGAASWPTWREELKDAFLIVKDFTELL